MKTDNKIEVPSKTFNLKIKEQTYEVKFPNTGQLLDIQQRKSIITNGQYGNFSDQGTSGLYAKYLADMIATFEVLIPKLKADLNVSIMELESADSKDLLNVYLTDFLPWYEKWLTFLNKVEDKATGKND